MKKQVTFGTESRSKIAKGVNILADAVKVTMGAKGRNVIIEREYGNPIITKDGVSVAREINLEDSLENIGAQVVKEVASKANETAGDGTTTSTVLAQAIFNRGMLCVESGSSPIDIKRGIDKATTVALQHLKDKAVSCPDVETWKSVATISANSDESIGSIISQAFDRVGVNGVVTIEEGRSFEDELEVVDGMQINSGYASPYFAADNEKMVVDFNDAMLFIINGTINSVQDVLPMMELSAQNSRPLVIIADNFDNQVISTLLVNSMRGNLKAVAIQSPSFGDSRTEILQDIAAMTGATIISPETGDQPDAIDGTKCGFLKRITVKKGTSTIVGDESFREDVNARVTQLQNKLKDSQSSFDQSELQERIAKLTGGVAVIRIGASSQVEMKEKKDRVEDALNATRAAIEEGIVAGGGVALLRIAQDIRDIDVDNEDQKRGVETIVTALEAPARQIISNAGYDPDEVISEIIKNECTSVGFNVTNGEYVDMFNEGIIDPAKVVRSSLQAASSVTGLLLTTEAVVALSPSKQQ